MPFFISEESTPDSIGQNVNAAIPVPSELAAFQAGMAQGQAFQVVTKREDGRNVTRFMSPLQAGSEVWW